MLFCFYPQLPTKPKLISNCSGQYNTTTVLHTSSSSQAQATYARNTTNTSLRPRLLHRHKIPPHIMEAKLCLPHGGIFTAKMNTSRRRLSLHTVQSVSTVPSRDEKLGVTFTKTAYDDNWFDRTAINYLSQSLQLTTGLKSDKTGYDSLVEAATVVSQRFDKEKQRELVMQTLDKAFPKPILSFIRMVLPPSKFTREYFAVFTTIFFAWLVGPCEVKEGTVDGRTEKNVVHIKKCRFLEGTSCIGMCTNLCKMPSQKFIKDSLGVPFHMVPNFDDMSCDMIFGEEPPAPSDDPALKQPCYKFICKAKKKHRAECAN